ncbi:MAG TPA: PQQ-binding-like beta-propeller repeat protein [Methylomusa anaerophila]|uniref:Outer membrane protein assembly factor BamB n=2 Tax=Methylomusa anaerophila TaxID=1930071 RepID=A0A348ALD8_9FIRM|nr:PQQ-binding-like beta-propeller repeat protein [Methylomusa anaerophila]BBB91886.1 outer membrane protein assembly factor BamB [Methylomusa anaerophila]HML88383.1 PQQ-binding-like beta-propeller repeat protein [Methylomusa anaerophila]
MKKLLTVLLMTVFAGSLLLLAGHIFPGLKAILSGAAPAGPDSMARNYEKVAEIPLGQVEAHDYRRMGFTSGIVRFSPDSRLLAVGTETGDVLLLSSDGRKRWQRQAGLAKITALEFARDGRSLYIGETSPQGALICVDVASGAELWHRDSAGELGVDIRQKTLPGTVFVAGDAQGNVYAVGQRYIRQPDGSNQYYSRIYKLDKSGGLTAMFPPDHNIDTWVSWIGVDDGGKRIAFGTANYDTSRVYRYRDNIYCLDGTLNRRNWSLLLDIVPPYQNTTMRKSPDMSADGRYIAAVTTDGRAFLYDAGGKELWRRSISQPQRIAGVYLNATGMYVRIAGERVLFTTGNTYNRANWQLPTPVEHPSSNSMFLFDLTGKLVNRHKAGGMIEEIAVNDTVVMLAVGRNIWTKDIKVHGMYVLSLPDGGQTDFLATAGPCVGVAVSADSGWIAGIEAPLRLDSGEIVGGYRLHIWKRTGDKSRTAAL